jgi:hypothetical protein
MFVGPSLGWTQSYETIFGITLATQDEGYWVYWSSGQVTMHTADEITIIPLENV